MKVQRRGFTLLEFIVALLLFGIAMSGLFPLVVMYSRVLESLEQRPSQLSLHRKADVDGNTYRGDNPTEWYQVGTPPYVRTDEQPNSGDWVHKWYLVPSSDTASTASEVWARKLGTSASIQYKSPASPPIVEALAEPTKPTNPDPNALDAGPGSNYAESEPAWTDEPSLDALGQSQRHAPGGAPASARWSFNVVDAAGWYQLQATGLVSGAAPATCSYTLSYGSPAVDVPIPVPANLTFGASSVWSPLMTKPLYFSANTVVTVQLNADASPSAIADGMRLVRCSLQITSFSVQPKVVESSIPETATASVEIKPAVRAP